MQIKKKKKDEERENVGFRIEDNIRKKIDANGGDLEEKEEIQDRTGMKM